MPGADDARSITRGKRGAEEKIPGTRSDDRGDCRGVKPFDWLKPAPVAEHVC